MAAGSAVLQRIGFVGVAFDVVETPVLDAFVVLQFDVGGEAVGIGVVVVYRGDVERDVVENGRHTVGAEAAGGAELDVAVAVVPEVGEVLVGGGFLQLGTVHEVAFADAVVDGRGGHGFCFVVRTDDEAIARAVTLGRGTVDVTVEAGGVLGDVGGFGGEDGAVEVAVAQGALYGKGFAPEGVDGREAERRQQGGQVERIVADEVVGLGGEVLGQMVVVGQLAEQLGEDVFDAGVGVVFDADLDFAVVVFLDKEVVEGIADAADAADDRSGAGYDGTDRDDGGGAAAGALGDGADQNHGRTYPDADGTADDVAHVTEVAHPVVLRERTRIGARGVEGELQTVGPQDDGVVDDDAGIEPAAVVVVDEDGDAVEMDEAGHLVLVETGISHDGYGVVVKQEIGGLDGRAVCPVLVEDGAAVGRTADLVPAVAVACNEGSTLFYGDGMALRAVIGCTGVQEGETKKTEK